MDFEDFDLLLKKIVDILESAFRMVKKVRLPDEHKSSYELFLVELANIKIKDDLTHMPRFARYCYSLSNDLLFFPTVSGKRRPVIFSEDLKNLGDCFNEFYNKYDKRRKDIQGLSIDEGENYCW